MSSIPYNYGSYMDAKVAMTDTGHVSAGKQIQSPASAGSRGLAKTTQFTNDRTQMQMGNSPIAESMIEIRSILNRIDGVNAPVQEDAGEKIANMAQNMTKDQFMSHADDLGLTPEEAAEHYEKMQGGAHVQEDDMRDMTISDLEAQLGKINDEITFLQIDQKDKESALAALGELRSVLDKYQSQKESAVQEDAGTMDWSTDKVKEFGNALIQLAKGQVPSDDLEIDDLEDGWAGADQNSRDQMAETIGGRLISVLIGYLQLSAGQKPSAEDVKDAQEVVNDPEFKKTYHSNETAVPEDSGELARLKELSGIEEDAGLTDEQKKGIEAIAKKYKDREGGNGDMLAYGYLDVSDTGIPTDGYDKEEMEAYSKKIGVDWREWDGQQSEDFLNQSETTGGATAFMIDDLIKVLGQNFMNDEKLQFSAKEYLDSLGSNYEPMPEGDEFDIEEDEDFEEVLGPLGFPEDETELFDAEYQGRKVPLNKPMRGDTKKFKVYVKDPKTGNVKKVNFGHGGTSAKRKTMRIRKSNPKARKSFRARHNCANPGPKTKARYWSCRKW